ncbi:MAG: hypothetical protein ACFFBT_13265 [Promethearchaeota archaeon]
MLRKTMMYGIRIYVDSLVTRWIAPTFIPVTGINIKENNRKN